MPLLRTEPPAPVRSMDELFAIAQSLEEEAAARYAGLAEEMRAAAMPAVAETFDRLAAEERGHATHVTEWSQTRTGHAPDPARIRWAPPETFDEEAAREIASSRLASAYRALSMAVRNEERAFALWTYIAAGTDDPDIRRAAERMASEELGHAAQLRRARRLAFHAERRPRGTPRLQPVQEAARSERALSAVLADLARRFPAHDAWRRIAAETAAMAEEIGRLAGPGAVTSAAAPRDIDTARRLGEAVVESLLEAADAAESEDAMRRLQALAARAIARGGALRQLQGDL